MIVAREYDSPQVDVNVMKKVRSLMQRCYGPKGRCEGSWECVTVVSIFRIHLGGVTLTREVYKPARRCSVNTCSVVLIYPGAMRSVCWCHLEMCQLSGICDSC